MLDLRQQLIDAIRSEQKMYTAAIHSRCHDSLNRAEENRRYGRLEIARELLAQLDAHEARIPEVFLGAWS